MLITYSDSLGNNLKDLYENLEKHFGDAVGGVHLSCHFSHQLVTVVLRLSTMTVDPAFGDWGKCQTLGRQVLSYV